MSVRCLHLCTSEAWGGLEIQASMLMAELQRNGCTVFAICAPGSKTESFLHSNGIETFHLPGTSPVSLRSIRTVSSLVRALNIDAVHTHFHRDIWPASLALRNDATTKLCMTVYMSVPKKNDPLHRFIYSRVGAIFSSSHELNGRLPRLYAVPPWKVQFLPYGIDLDRFVTDDVKRCAVRKQYGVNANDFLVGMAIRIDPGKGVMEFLESFLYLEKNVQSNTTYLIAGEPTRKAHASAGESPFENHCEQYFRELQVFVKREQLEKKIHFSGFQSDVIGYLSAMDTFVFPSRDEFYSIAVLEAMSMRLPVIAAQSGGNIHQITNGTTGLLYTSGDARDLAEKISRYASSPGDRHQHGSAARCWVEQVHDMRTTITTLLDFYTGRSPSSSIINRQ